MKTCNNVLQLVKMFYKCLMAGIHNCWYIFFVVLLDLGCVQVILQCLLLCLSCLFSVINDPAYINNVNLRENARFGFAGIAVIQLLLAPAFF